MKVSDAALDRLGLLIAEDNAPLGLVLDGRYRVVSRLARGGMGEIFRASDLRLRRDVALKVLGAGLSAPAWTARFRDEALTMSRIDHPGVVPIHDLGVLPDGRAWYAMKVVDGRTLDAVLAAEGDLRTRVRLLVQVTAVVQHAHERGVIHRDLKPANVMVGANAQVYVLDWGIAKVRDEFRLAGAAGPQPGPGKTGAGDVLGTLEYMPPEQARGEAAAIDARSDVYALGALLYEMLAGRPPVQGAHETALLLKAQAGAARPPRERKSGVPADLDAVCMKALAREPGDRYPSARAFAEELGRWLDGEAVEARRPSRLHRLWKRVLRHKTLAAASTAAVAASAALLGYWLDHREDAAAAAEKRLEDQVFGPIRRKLQLLPTGPESWTRGLALLDAALASHDRSWDGWLLKGQLHERLGEARAALDAYARAAALNPRLTTAPYRRGRIFMDALERPDDARREFERVLAIDARDEFALVGRARLALLADDLQGALQQCRAAEAVAGHLPDLHFLRGLALAKSDPDAAIAAYTRVLQLDPAHAAALNNRGNAWSAKKDYPAAVRDFDAALRLQPRQALFHLNRAKARAAAKDWEPALGDAGRAIELAPLDPEAWSLRSEARYRLRDDEAALKDVEEALRLDPSRAKDIANRGLLLTRLGRKAEGERDQERSLALDPKQPNPLVSRGGARFERGDVEGARADFEAALALDPGHAGAIAGRARVLRRKGDLEGALRAFDRSIELDPTIAATWGNRGNARLDQGDLEGAIADQTAALKLDPRSANTWNNRGFAFLQKGDLDAAVRDFDKALELDPAYSRALANRGLARLEMKDVARARADLEAALALWPAGSPGRKAVEETLDGLRK